MKRKIKFEYKITLLYILLGSLWILFSDELLNKMNMDTDLLTKFQTYKGWLFVLVTALVFYLILSKHLTRLRNAEIKSRESDMLKTAFLRNVSHEIRTPMNSIIGFATLLDTHGISEDRKSEYLKIINNSSKKLLAIVNEIMEISLIETGNLTVHEKHVNLNRIIDEVHLSFQPQMKPEIEFSIKKGLQDSECRIVTDEIMLKKVLSNIISNAFKFTENGHIAVSYKVRNNDIEFSVEDTGIGIPAEFMPHLFDSFRKVDSLQSQYYDGLGLGLSISKGSLKLLNGNIWVESNQGKGSTFFFTIPYKPVSEESM